MFKLAVSNIAWPPAADSEVLQHLVDNGYQGLEIAPTRLIPDKPYLNKDKVKRICNTIAKKYGIDIISMQSIHYGMQENLFESSKDFNVLISQTHHAIDLAEAIKCPNIVFGSPKNRRIPPGGNINRGYDFFSNIADYASKKNVVIAIEPNPVIYETNYINTTQEAITLAQHIDSSALKVNVDFGTILANHETFHVIENFIDIVNHIHISEPYLAPLKKRHEHSMFLNMLHNTTYNKYISIEMKQTDTTDAIKKSITYLKSLI